MSSNVSELVQQANLWYKREGLAPLSGVFKSDGKYPLADILSHGGANQSPNITNKFTRPGRTIIIRRLTAVLIVAAVGGGRSSVWVPVRGGSSGDRGWGQVRGQGRGLEYTNDSPSQLVSQLKKLTRKYRHWVAVSLSTNRHRNRRNQNPEIMQDMHSGGGSQRSWVNSDSFGAYINIWGLCVIYSSYLCLGARKKIIDLSRRELLGSMKLGFLNSRPLPDMYVQVIRRQLRKLILWLEILS